MKLPLVHTALATIASACWAACFFGCIPDLTLKEDAGAVAASSGGATGAGGSMTVPYEPLPAVVAWLDTNRGGWCNDTYNKFINLCGNVSFCIDKTFLKPYPKGFAVDVGFHWLGIDGGSILSLGGDIDGKKMSISLQADGLLTVLGPGNGTPLQFRITKRSHLVSYRVSPSQRTLFIDGIRVDEGTTDVMMGGLELYHGPDGGPGAVLGQAISYWNQDQHEPEWLRFAPFLFHIREGAGSTTEFSLAEATTPQPTTLALFHGAMPSDTAWKATVGPGPAYAAGGPKWIEDIDANCL